jgi:hypothetical protein
MQHGHARTQRSTVRRVNPRLLLLALLSFSLVAAAQPQAQLEQAEKAVRELEYSTALKLLDGLRKTGNTDRATTVRVAELTAITLATLGQDTKALKAFQVVLSLEPDFKLQGSYPPRVTTAFYEARGWVDANKALEAKQLPTAPKNGVLPELQVELINDPLKLVKEVRFFVLVDGKLTTTDVAVTGAKVSAPVNLPRVAWWAALLGEQKAVLAELGSPNAARTEAAPPLPVAANKPKPDELKPRPEPMPVVEPARDEAPIGAWETPEPAAAPMNGKRVAAIGLVAGAAVVAGVGIGFGVMANGTKAKVSGATTDADGRITGLTQREALVLDAQQRTQATIANVLIISGAALAAGGVTLFILSRDEATVALVPAGAGLGVVGTF